MILRGSRPISSNVTVASPSTCAVWGLSFEWIQSSRISHYIVRDDQQPRSGHAFVSQPKSASENRGHSKEFVLYHLGFAIMPRFMMEKELARGD